MKLHYHQQARFELADAVTWYAADSVSNAERFKTEFETLVESILRMPERFMPGVAGTKKARLKRYPYSIIFKKNPDGITIFAIAHDKRRPGYWTERVVR